jgi:hypothetical protein
MTNTLYIVIPLATLFVGGFGGYCIGYYQRELLERIRFLETQDSPAPEQPGVIMGAYGSEHVVTTENIRAAGVVETATPQRLEWEHDIKVDNEVLGKG